MLFRSQRQVCRRRGAGREGIYQSRRGLPYFSGRSLCRGGLQNEEDQDDDALTGVLVQETEALTGVLDQGFDETSRLKLSQLTVKKDIEMNRELWAAPVPEVIMTETHHIVFIHTDKNIS